MRYKLASLISCARTCRGKPGGGDMAPWIGWRDGRGYQARDTGYRL